MCASRMPGSYDGMRLKNKHVSFDRNICFHVDRREEKTKKRRIRNRESIQNSLNKYQNEKNERKEKKGREKQARAEGHSHKSLDILIAPCRTQYLSRWQCNLRKRTARPCTRFLVHRLRFCCRRRSLRW